MTDDEVNAKFRGFAGRTLSKERANRALELLWGIEKTPNADPLFEALRSDTIR